MTSLDSLIQYFEKFPGIGNRQARRFAFHLLTLSEDDLIKFSELIKDIHKNVVLCPSCRRFHTLTSQNGHCRICIDENRDHAKLTVVERDSDIDAIERGGAYNGLYFVLGGTVPLLNSQDTNKIRGGALKKLVEDKASELDEVILAFPVNPDGENTGRYVESLIKELADKNTIAISYLGRGLSTGSELEYADSETIKNAFKNRH